MYVRITTRPRPNHLPSTYRVIKFITKPFTTERGHITPPLIRQSGALSSQKPPIHFETSASITHFSPSTSVTHFFVYIISLLLSLLLLLFSSYHFIRQHLRYSALLFVLCFFCFVYHRLSLCTSIRLFLFFISFHFYRSSLTLFFSLLSWYR